MTENEADLAGEQSLSVYPSENHKYYDSTWPLVLFHNGKTRLCKSIVFESWDVYGRIEATREQVSNLAKCTHIYSIPF